MRTGKSFEYGWVRGAGSAAFIAGAIVAGQAASRYQLSAIIWLSAMGLLAAAMCALIVPAFPRPPAIAAGTKRGPDRAWLLLLHQRAFVYVTVVAALVLGSHAMHDSFAVIRWTEAGISPATTGLLWSASVAAEVVVFFLIGPRLLRALGPTVALAIAAAAGVLRWVVMAQTVDVAMLAMVQPLHGFTFALLHLACMQIITATVPPALAGTAQAVYGLIGVGGATAAADDLFRMALWALRSGRILGHGASLQSCFSRYPDVAKRARGARRRYTTRLAKHSNIG